MGSKNNHHLSSERRQAAGKFQSINLLFNHIIQCALEEKIKLYFVSIELIFDSYSAFQVSLLLSWQNIGNIDNHQHLLQTKPTKNQANIRPILTPAGLI